VAEDLVALVGVREREGLAKAVDGGVGAASSGKAAAEEFEGGEDASGAHVFVLATADGVGEACEGGALLVEQIEGVAVTAEGQVVFAGLLTEIFHSR
jgi:hypothetical protein